MSTIGTVWATGQGETRRNTVAAAVIPHVSARNSPLSISPLFWTAAWRKVNLRQVAPQIFCGIDVPPTDRPLRFRQAQEFVAWKRISDPALKFVRRSARAHSDIIRRDSLFGH